MPLTPIVWSFQRRGQPDGIIADYNLDNAYVAPRTLLVELAQPDRHNNNCAARSESRLLFELDARGIDYFGPARDFGFQIVAEILRCAAYRHQPVTIQAIAHIGLLK